MQLAIQPVDKVEKGLLRYSYICEQFVVPWQKVNPIWRDDWDGEGKEMSRSRVGWMGDSEGPPGERNELEGGISVGRREDELHTEVEEAFQ
ncbi:hypothetical protein E1B28_011703 [Marasmius oreades]|uniref:Uncharacterized protein n=1 Tax=Marasmius oreades TaxID=181124 RepID=A0A9P7RUL7_9AGAR|nr:uncharacterized protein E1B28_011703 [Marasmius oreades]KAG7090086.1 hypothetical protein E1B28_011703 [Marasmius oreades]